MRGTQARGMQGVHVWFGGWGSGPDPDDAKGSCEPGSGGAEKSVACREPGSLGACERVGQKVDGEREQPITLYT
jgi:hypothetical protein